MKLVKDVIGGAMKRPKVTLAILFVISFLFIFSIQRNLDNLHEDAMFLAKLGENVYVHGAYSLQTPFQLESFGGETFRINIIEDSAGLGNLPADNYPPLIPMLWVIAYSLMGVGLHAVVLILFISLLLPFLVYSLGSHMYDKGVGLIAGVVLFGSPALLVLSLGMTDVVFTLVSYLGLFALYRFVKTGKGMYMLMLGFFLGLSVLTRVNGIIFLFIVPLSLVFIGGLSELKKAKNWYWLVPFLLILGVWQIALLSSGGSSTHGHYTSYFLSYKGGDSFQLTYIFSFLDSLFETPASIMGAFGYLLAAIGLLGWYKSRDVEGKLLIMWILAALPFFVFYKSEPRLLFPIIGSLAIFAGRGFWWLSRVFAERKRDVTVLLVVLLALSYVAGLNQGGRDVIHDSVGRYEYLKGCGDAINDVFSEQLGDGYIWTDTGASLRYYADYKMVYVAPLGRLWENREARNEFIGKYNLEYAVFCGGEMPEDAGDLAERVGDSRLYRLHGGA